MSYPSSYHPYPMLIIEDWGLFCNRILTFCCDCCTMNKQFAAVVESADTRDLKSLGSNIVPVQVRSAAPERLSHAVGVFFAVLVIIVDVI